MPVLIEVQRQVDVVGCPERGPMRDLGLGSLDHFLKGLSVQDTHTNLYPVTLRKVVELHVTFHFLTCPEGRPFPQGVWTDLTASPYSGNLRRPVLMVCTQFELASAERKNVAS